MISLAELRKNALFSDVKISELRRILPTLRKEYYPRSAEICKEGDVGSCLYIILSGQIKLTTTIESTHTETLTYLNAGDFFGEGALLSNEPRTVTAEAAIDAEVLLLGRQSFYDLVECDPTVMHNIIRTIDRRLRRRTWRMFHQQPKQSQIISVYSPKKVRIKTFVAVNLAASLYKQTGHPVVILDMTMTSPNIALILGMPVCQTIGEKDVNEDTLNAVLCSHTDGFDLVTMSADLLRTGQIAREKIAGVLSVLKTRFQYIVINTSAEISNNTFEALDLSDRVVLLSPIGEEPPSGMFDHQDLIAVYYFPQDTLQRDVHLTEGAPLILPPGEMEEQHFYDKGEIVTRSLPNTEVSVTIDRIARHVAGMRIGLALGGMAARGLSHIGVLKVLEEHHIPIDMIAGTNTGAIVGAMYALGMSASDIERMVLGLQQHLPLVSIRDFYPFKGGLLGHRRIIELLSEYIPHKITFHQLKIPLRIITMALDVGQEVVLNTGLLFEGIEASIAMPGIFPPVKCGEKYLVDGTSINPVPLSDLLEMGADILVGVNSFAPLTPSYTPPPEDYENLVGCAENLKIIDIIIRSFQNLQYEISTAKGMIADVTIAPELIGYTWNDFGKAEGIIKAGEKAARNAIADIENVINNRRLYRKV